MASALASLRLPKLVFRHWTAIRNARFRTRCANGRDIRHINVKGGHQCREPWTNLTLLPRELLAATRAGQLVALVFRDPSLDRRQIHHLMPGMHGRLTTASALVMLSGIKWRNRPYCRSS